jgi:hypothetical protein
MFDLDVRLASGPPAWRCRPCGKRAYLTEADALAAIDALRRDWSARWVDPRPGARLHPYECPLPDHGGWHIGHEAHERGERL